MGVRFVRPPRPLSNERGGTTIAEILCYFCGKPIRPRDRGTHHLISGWVAQRTQGGANAVRLMRDEGKLAHRLCVDEAKMTFAEKRQGVMDLDV